MAEKRIYQKYDVVTFCKTRDPFGELSNCNMGFPLVIPSLNLTVKSTEHLYQALKHPNDPELQQAILDEPSPIGAKHRSYTKLCRPDWVNIHIRVMTVMLVMKTHQHNTRIRFVLDATGDKPIVEYSRKDDFWGAVEGSDDTLIGVNALGRLWMQQRDWCKSEQNTVPRYDDFCILLDQNVTLF